MHCTPTPLVGPVAAQAMKSRLTRAWRACSVTSMYVVPQYYRRPRAVGGGMCMFMCAIRLVQVRGI